MKVYLENYNGVLDGMVEHYSKTGQLTDNFHNADVFVLWQDVRGDCLQLARIVKHQLKKPLVVMQHGRGAVRDYGHPNNFELLADKIMVWGEVERKRLLSYGISDKKIAVVGCPLLPFLRPKPTGRTGINVLFVPVISTKEEPENILVFAELKKWESDRLISRIYRDFDRMKKSWAYQDNEIRRIVLPNGATEDRLWKSEIKPVLPRNVTYLDGLVNVKLTGIHDIYQYQAPIILTQQGEKNHARVVAELLGNIDIMVCLEEGTMQLLACALDIPVIVCDIFKYENYGGVQNYDTIEKIKTNACYWVNSLNKLSDAIEHALKNRPEKRAARIAMCNDEGGADMGDLDANACRAIESCVKEIAAV